MSENSAHGYGLATLTEDGDVLDVWFPEPRLGVPAHDPEPEELTALTGDDPVRQVRKAVVHVVVDDLAAAPADTYDVWLRLHLLSHRLVKPHGLNLDGQFGLLTNVVWTTIGPCAVAGFEHTRARARAAGLTVNVTSIDKFPRMTDYVIPSGVRIGDADRVRLGAHLAEGTTVMHEGFVNFNAGTLGSSPSAAGACSARTRASASPSATTASWRRAATSRPARRCAPRTARSSRRPS